MSQDTRKDQRAKVVSLNVRYKSATVDEFIENHSHDVSKGGIFVKTPTPFAPGTLLKFEIRLAGDKSVIAGVGRVVWKREPTQSGADKPAGMGVKFIKIDDGSRVVIDRLVAQKSDAGSAYESVTPQDGLSEPPPEHPSTLRGLAAAPPASPAAPPPAAKPAPVSVPSPGASGPKLPVPPAATAEPAARPANKSATVMGVAPPSSPAIPPSSPSAKPTPVMTGAVAPPPPPSSVPRPVGVGAPTPRAREPAAGAPARPVNPRKATMMGIGNVPPPSAAGASTDDVDEALGNLESLGEPLAASPGLPSPAPSPAPRAATPAPKPASPMFSSFTASPEPVNEPTVMKQAAELLEEALREAGGSLEEIGQNPLFSGLVDGSSGGKPSEEPAPVSVRVQSGETVVMGSPSAPPPPVTSSSMSPSFAAKPAAGASQGASSVASSSSPLLRQPAPAKRSSTGIAVALGAVLLLAGGGVFAWQSGMLGGGGAPVPPSATAPAPTPAPSPPPRVVADAAPATSAAPPASAAPSAADAADAAAVEAVVDAGKASRAVAQGAEKPEPPKPVAPAPVRPRPRPAAPTVAAPTGEAPPDPKPEGEPKPEPKPEPAPVPAPPSPVPDPN